MDCRNIKGFKSSMKTQTTRLNKLQDKLKNLRNQYSDCLDKPEKRHSLESEAGEVKSEIKHIEAYLKKCQEVIYRWIDATDAEINALANYKYWRNT